MRGSDARELLITGAGVTTSIGQGNAMFLQGLLRGDSAFAVMQRPGRQKESAFLGAELEPLEWPAGLKVRRAGSLSLTSQVALITLAEAWQEARLAEVDPVRVGLVVGGSNLQQRALVQAYEELAERPYFVNPSYAFSFLDSDVCGVCTEQFGIRGPAYTLGGASASGQMCVIRAAQAVAGGEVDVCIALGALMDLSYWECHALRSLGAMGSDRFAQSPAEACRPYDRRRDGFIFGEACAAVVIERGDTAARRRVSPYAAIRGWAMAVEGCRSPEASLAGETRAIHEALQAAGVEAGAIDYVNPHASGSVAGDAVELQALRDCGLAHAPINATKSLTGHGLAAAGAVEVVATLLQMRAATLHPSRNLEEPLDASFDWVRDRRRAHDVELALTLSFGFGGINTCVCLQRLGVSPR
jgi:malonyl-ACP decarboxylase